MSIDIALLAAYEECEGRTELKLSSLSISKNCFVCLFAVILGLLSIKTAHAQIFVSNFTGNSIGEYNLDGTAINASLISGLNGTSDIAISGSNLLVANYTAIGEYTASGTAINASLISGLTNPQGIAISGSNLFVNSGNSIGEYTTSGTVENASLVSGLNQPTDIAISGSNLFVTNLNSGTIGEYTTSGTLVNASLVSGLNEPTYLLVEASPEPSSWALLLGGLGLLAFWRLRRTN